MPSYAAGHRFFINELDESVDAIFLDVVQAAEEHKLIEFWINSEGGDATRAFSLVALMKRAEDWGATVKTVVLSDAHSAGSVVAVAGTPGHRFVAPGASYLLHYGEVELVARGPEELRRISLSNQVHFQRLIDHYVVNTNLTEEQLQKRIAFDNCYIYSEDAIALGMADKLLTSD